MAHRQDNLARLVGYFARGTLPRPSLDGIWRAGLYSEVDAVYRALGGRLPDVPLNLGRWDVECTPQLVLELDEQLHFNRYRAVTLESQLYAELPGFPITEYTRYCADHEDRCLAAGGMGGKWTSPSSERQFGAASSPRDLSGIGAPRWRQRAFYDFVKDLSPLLGGPFVVRISIWDEIQVEGQPYRVGNILRDAPTVSRDGLLQLIRQRLAT